MDAMLLQLVRCFHGRLTPELLAAKGPLTTIAVYDPGTERTLRVIDSHASSMATAAAAEGEEAMPDWLGDESCWHLREEYWPMTVDMIMRNAQRAPYLTPFLAHDDEGDSDLGLAPALDPDSIVVFTPGSGGASV
ncbi:hypothetical protein AMAG_20767 [Allomyces macrogynus ATCC 38327]|uniref:Uncharacterized protein n=1 Tax=Allomyces macrogynus (strain ATCC 38327) TaxID=578462 RepID=A0A0L0TF09_ALLM3|nr:hypothetical protein AMAG_20767 [Allomyces macrogynus ATCC 38327]|eukprot:KNE73332.1 hypothetical protein AMAG_20767 [Allomyces macrogynus ATCC 38327]